MSTAGAELLTLADLAGAQSAVADLLLGLADRAWARPTPCVGWDVAAVTRHLITGERAFTVSLGGNRYDLEAISSEVSALDVDALAPTYVATRLALHDALAVAGPGTFPTGLGPMSAPDVARLRTIEALTHGWDVARAVQHPLDVEEPVCERAVDHARALMQRVPPDRTPFAPPQPVAGDAPALDRLVGLLGRSPG